MRWVDINKGDEVKPEYRSRLVAQEIKRDKSKDLFAATPPLEAKKVLFSLLASTATGTADDPLALDFIDISRAHFHANAIRGVYVKLPPEVDEPGKRGRLQRAIPGTRDAAQRWERNFVLERGFKQGKSNPRVFHHVERCTRAAAHGDDFTVLADKVELDWLRSKIAAVLQVKFRARLVRGVPGAGPASGLRLGYAGSV